MPLDQNASHLALGEQTERRAEQFLQLHHWHTRARNYRCKVGEIDLIMEQGNQLIFVEVRLRSHREFAHASESVTLSKQKKIIKAAQRYLQEHRLTDKAYCRFDVVAFSAIDSEPEWIQNAFLAS
jgi:putative endonuclease